MEFLNFSIFFFYNGLDSTKLKFAVVLGPYRWFSENISHLY